MTTPIARALVLACIVAATGCASAPREPEICLGKEYLAVRNETGEAVDIYMIRGNTQHVLGTVGAGRTELPLPPELGRNVGFQGRRTRDGRWIARAFGGRDDSARLDMRVECGAPREPRDR